MRTVGLFTRRLLLPAALSMGFLGWFALRSPGVKSQPSLQVGYGVLTTEDAVPPLVSALFRLINPEGVLVTEAAVPGVRPLRSAAVFVQNQGTRRTAIALANLASETATLQLTLYAADGSELATESREFKGEDHQAVFMDEIFDLGSDFLGSLRIEVEEESHPGVAVVTLRQGVNHLGEPILTTLPVVDLEGRGRDSDRFVLPQVGVGSAGTLELATQLVLINPTEQVLSGVVELFGTDGLPLEFATSETTGSAFLYEIPARGVEFLEFRSPSSAEAQRGYAVVSSSNSTPLPSGSAVFQFRTLSGEVVSEAGVGSADELKSARAFIDSVGTRTGVALANPGAMDADLELDLLDSNGLAVGSSSLDVPAGTQVAAFADELFELPFGFSGALAIRSGVPFVLVSLKLTINSRGEPILTTLPVLDESVEPSGEPWILPQVAFGSSPVGEFSTRLFMLSSAFDGSGSLAFLAAGGEGLELPHGSDVPVAVPTGSTREFLPGNPAEASSIVLDSGTTSVSELIVNAGQSIHPRFLVVDTTGQIRNDFIPSLLSIDETVARVDGLGRLFGLQAGFSTLIATSGPAVESFPVTVAQVVSSSPGFTAIGLAQDLSGRLYLANSEEHTILFTPGLDISPSLYAGAAGTPGLQDGPRLESRFDNPSFLALDRARAGLYASDSRNHAIRSVGPGLPGEVGTLAGSGSPGSSDGAGEVARFNQPQGIALDDRGFLWVADSENHTIRRIDLSTREVDTVAGSAGQEGSADGTGPAARFRNPAGVALETEPLALQLERERRGEPPRPVSVLVADTGNNAVRRVWEDGRVETLRASGEHRSSGSVSRQSAGSLLVNPVAVALDPRGNIYVSSSTMGDVLVLLAGGGTSRAAQSGTFENPTGLGSSLTGNLLVIQDTAKLIRYGVPVINSIEPEEFSDAGGGELVVTGRNFSPESLLTVCGVVIDSAEVIDSTAIHAILPRLPSGRGTVTVLNRGGLVQAGVSVRPQDLADLEPGQVTTVAGGSTFAGDGGPALGARLVFPAGLDIDPDGDLIVADPGNNRIREIDHASGLIRTVAGTGRLGGEGDGGPAISADLAIPRSVVLDGQGNILVADSANFRIRRVNRADRSIETVAGTGQSGFSGDGGPALAARFDEPEDLALDRLGNLYVADLFNHRIRKIDAVTGIVTTVAGTGQAGFSGDGGPATQARLNLPFGVGIDGSGSLLIADTRNHRIRRVDLDTGVITSIAGTGSGGYWGDGGPSLTAGLFGPSRVRSDPDGNIVIADTVNQRIRIIDSVSGLIDTVAGSGAEGYEGDGGPAAAAAFAQPQGIAVDGAGNLFISDHFNQVVRKVNLSTRYIERYAGRSSDYPGDGDAAWKAALNFPRGVDVNENGDLLIADTGNSRIRRIDGSSGTMTTVAGDGSFAFSGDGGPAALAALDRPDDVVVDQQGNIWISDSFNHRIRQIDLNGTITTRAGVGVPGYWGDNGPANLAALYYPQGITSDGDGYIYFADNGNQRIRRIDPTTGRITTVAGSGFRGYSGDSGPAVAAWLNRPSGVAIDPSGNLLIADTGNGRIRLVDLTSGVIRTVAGISEFGFSGDGGPATEARLNLPHSIEVDDVGNIFFTDHFNQRVRRIDAVTGFIDTVGGNGTATFSGDGGDAHSASFLYPAGLAVDLAGNVFIADSQNDRVRAIRGNP